MNAGELKKRMAERAADIAKYLLPDGKQRAGEWKAGNTLGESGDSLSVCIRGAKAGVWKDFASDEGGDLLDLWMACRGMSLVDAMKEAKQYLGIRDDFPKPPEKVYRKPESPKVPAARARVLEWLMGRGLTEETVRAFKIAEQQQYGKTFALFPYIDDTGELLNIKHRNIDQKSDMRQEAGAAPCLFGWHLINPKCRVVVITEGEIDCMSLHQVGIPALSINQGAGNHQWIEVEFDRLSRFEEILVCFDNDEAGDKGAPEVIRRLGVERCRRMRVGAKDANEWLQSGAERVDFLQAMDEAKPMDPDELKNADEFTPEVEALFYPDPNAPRDPVLQFDRQFDFFEFRTAEYTCWTGINGHGKSLMLDQILLGLMAQGERVVVFSGEMVPGRHLLRMHKQATGLGKPTREYIRAVGAWLRERCWLFDLVGIARLDRLLEVFSYAARRYGARHFVIDSLMMIDVPADGPGAITKQNEAVQKITAFAKAHGAHIHIVAHPRKLKDEAEAPNKMEVAGAGGIVNRADNVFSIWRAQKDEAPPNPNDAEAAAAWQAKQGEFDAKLILKKQRNGDVQDYTLLLWFDKASQQYRSQPRRYPLNYVPFSTQDQEVQP